MLSQTCWENLYFLQKEKHGQMYRKQTCIIETLHKILYNAVDGSLANIHARVYSLFKTTSSRSTRWNLFQDPSSAHDTKVAQHINHSF